MIKLKFRKVIAAIFVLVCSEIHSQNGCNFSNEEYNMYMCLENFSGYASSMGSQSMVSEILNKVGISDANFILKTCDKTNNATAIFWKNKRYIILDEYYLDSLNKNDRYWFYLFVLSHEIGHHLYGHMFEKVNLERSRSDELQADKFAGLIIRKFGGSINNITAALKSINHPQLNNSSHPILNDRLNAAYLGYNSAIEEEKNVLAKYNVITEKEYLSFQKTKDVARARIKGIDYLLHNSNKNLDEAIKLYTIAVNGYDNADLLYELSSLYSLKNDLHNAELYIQKAHSINQKPEYIILGWNYCIENKGTTCHKYEQKINNIDYKTITDPSILKILSLYFNNISNNNLDIEKLQIAEHLLHLAKDKLELRGKLYQEDNLLLSDIYNDLSVVDLRKEDFEEAYTYVKKAIMIRDNMEQTKSEIDHLNEIDIENYSHLYSNKALIEMRLELWEACLSSCDKLVSFNPNYENVSNGDVFYFKGRSLHNLKKYNEALSNYNQAIKFSQTNLGYLYFYRGLTYLALNDSKNSCMDFRIACDKGMEVSCNRYNNMCN